MINYMFVSQQYILEDEKMCQPRQPRHKVGCNYAERMGKEKKRWRWWHEEEDRLDPLWLEMVRGI